MIILHILSFTSSHLNCLLLALLPLYALLLLGLSPRLRLLLLALPLIHVLLHLFFLTKVVESLHDKVHFGYEFILVLLGAGIVIYYLLLEVFELFSELLNHV